jgi:hypothetical protein
MRNSALGLLFPFAATYAQELEPRTYSPSPIGTRFLIANWSYQSGDVLTDSTLPITGVHAHFNLYSLGYVTTFSVLEHTATFGFGVPVANGDVSANVVDASRQVHRAGLGDIRLRFAVNLFGNPPLPVDAFMRAQPGTSVGTSLTIIAPTGQYIGTRLVNIGANRWSFKPEIGISQPLGNWFVDGSAGVWFFTDNGDFFGGNQRSQAPLMTFQVHGGYSFRPGLWIAADLGYGAGGRSAVNGIEGDDRQANVRYGFTLSVPISRGWSTKLAFSHGLVARAGGDFTSVALTLQYRWFGR